MKSKSNLLAISLSACLISPASYAEVKNLILMIGDGMGPQQVGLLELYTREAPNSIYNGEKTAMIKFSDAGLMGLSLNNPDDAIVVDSACSATFAGIRTEHTKEEMDEYETRYSEDNISSDTFEMQGGILFCNKSRELTSWEYEWPTANMLSCHIDGLMPDHITSTN